MPSIKYKDKTYGSATFPFVEMTREEYDMLPPSKQNDGTLYLISDDDVGWGAERCVYDNTQSGLAASNVQDVVDELDRIIDTIENPTFSEASTRDNIISGESLAIIFGKIKRVINDLETIAFSGMANNVEYDNTTSGMTATDVQGALDELNANINSDVVTSINRSGTQFTAKNSSGESLFTFDQQDNNTTYSAGTGLSLSGTTFSLPNSGVTAGTYGPSANVSGSNGATINVPQITVNAQGKVTSVTNRVYTSVNTDTNTWNPNAIQNITRSGTTFTATRQNGTTFTFTQQDNNTTTGLCKYVKTTQNLSMSGNEKRWVTPTKPTDTAYNWYLLSCASDNSIWVLHTSQTGVYLFHNATGSVSCDTGYYWLGVRK